MNKFLLLSPVYFIFQLSVLAQTFSTVSVSPGDLTGVYKSSLDWGDYDQDGDLDIAMNGEYPSNNEIAKIYRNDGEDTFTDISASLQGTAEGTVEWGDYDNDGDLDLLLTGYDGFSYFKIYRNDGNDTFTDIDVDIPPTSFGSVSWGDADNDGDLDILLVQSSNSGIYVNLGNDTFEKITFNTGWQASFSKGAWGDYDNDGDLDVAINFSSSEILFPDTLKILRNDGNLNFTDIGSTFEAYQGGSIEWGDYDNDGDLDILASGMRTMSTYNAEIIKNKGDDTFELTTISLTGIYNGVATWDDADNDGDLDIFLAGSVDGGKTAELWINNGSDNFQKSIQTFDNSHGCDAEWGDYDNDGDLDILFSGMDESSTPVTRIYENGSSTGNNPPSVPGNLNSSQDSTTVTITWSESTDNETPQLSLSYNMSIGKWKDSTDVMSPMSNRATGFKLTPEIGNTHLNNFHYLHRLPPGKYYYKVQAVDNIFRGSAFSEVDSFVMNPVASFSMATSSCANKNVTVEFTGFVYDTLNTDFQWDFDGGNIISGSGIGPFTIQWPVMGQKTVSLTVVENGISSESASHEIAINQCFTYIAALTDLNNGDNGWADYNNDGYLDLLICGNSYDGTPITELYENNKNGTFTKVPNSGIQHLTNAAFDFGDLDNDGYLDLAIIGTNSSYEKKALIYLNVSKTNSIPFQQTGTVLPGASKGSVDWGDYDNDGDLDLLYAGNGPTRLYKNSSGNFSAVTTDLPAINYGTAAWGDYDNDGDLDVLMTDGFSRIYRNDGEDIFTDIEAGLVGLSESKGKWGDYDQDGDLDLVISGTGSGRQTFIYKNQGNHLFDMVNDSIIGAYKPMLDWGDYDNDGDLDLIIAGDNDVIFNPREKFARIYRNNGNDWFEYINYGFPGFYAGGVHWGDIDNDHDLDLVIQGGPTFGISQDTRIYRNDGPVPNTIPSEPGHLQSVVEGSKVTLSWDPATDDQTEPASLSYNLRLGTHPDSIDIISPSADISSGKTRMPGYGNANLNTSIFYNLPIDQYFWSVQTLDNTFEGSAYTPVETFTIYPLSTFILSQESICGKDTVLVEYNGNASPYPDAVYTWDFNNGDIITGSHEGPYQVNWIAEGVNKPDDGVKVISFSVVENEISSVLTRDTLTVHAVPDIITQPVNTSVCEASSISIGFELFGYTGIEMQWETWDEDSWIPVNNGNTFSNVFSDTLTVSNCPVEYDQTAYRCRITSTECGKTIFTDSIILTVRPLTSITSQPSDQSRCFGDDAEYSITAIGHNLNYQWFEGTASGGWTMMIGETNPVLDINNVNSTMSGINYYCTVSGDCGPAQNSNIVTLTVNPLPFINLGTEISICESEEFFLDAGPGFSGYDWNTGDTTRTIRITSDDTYRVTVTDINGCSITDEVLIVIDPAIPAVDLGPDRRYCSGDEIILNAANQYDRYSWSNGSTDPSIQIDTSGTYHVTVSNNNTVCEESDTVHILVAEPYDQEKICLITIDMATGNNIIVWEKTASVGIVAYNIYRQTTTAGVYEPIATVPYENLSIYMDEEADPEIRQWVYKITAIDTCNNESDIKLSPYHRPLFLEYNGTDNGVNLRWEPYVVEGTELEFLTYEIYRGSDSVALSYLNEVSGDLKVYKDIDPNAMKYKYFYRVAGVKSVPCYPAAGKKADAGPYSHSMSNIEDNRLEVIESIGKLKSGSSLKIFPNPFSHNATLKFINPDHSEYRLVVRDLSGKVVYSMSEITGNEVKLERGDLTAGYYLIELAGENIFRGRIIVE